MVKVKKGKGGNRKETRSERQARISSQREARQACEKMIPYLMGGVVVLLLLFGLYVRSLPPKDARQPRLVKQQQQQQQQQAGSSSVPDFMNIPVDHNSANDADASETERAAWEQVMQMLKEQEAAGNNPKEGEKQKGNQQESVTNDSDASTKAETLEKNVLL